jgi:hypothetical protein
MYFGRQNAGEVNSEEDGFIQPTFKWLSSSPFQGSWYFFGTAYPFPLLILVGSEEQNSVKHVARDVFSTIRETMWETVCEFEFHLCIFLLEEFLECKALPQCDLTLQT